jgi:hypothetical protein
MVAVKTLSSMRHSAPADIQTRVVLFMGVSGRVYDFKAVID